MPTTIETKKVAAQREQSDHSKRATLDLLKNKKRASSEFTIYVTDGDGEKQEVTMEFQSIGAVAYEKLVAKHPPKAEQRVEGASYDINTFAPALISACSVDPVIEPKDAKEIWDSPDWSRGDLMVLFMKAVELNNKGIDIPFSEAD